MAKRIYEKARRATVVMSAATFRDIEKIRQTVPDPLTGDCPISFSRLMSMLAEGWLKANIVGEDTDADG